MVLPVPNLSSQGYATVDEYVQDVLSKIETKDDTLTTLQIDDLHYPMCGGAAVDVMVGGSGSGGSVMMMMDYLDSETIANLLTKAPHSPHIRSLELRFVEFDEPVSRAFQSLLMDDPHHRTWDSISITACSGLSSDDFCALASVLENRCHTLHWHHNDTSYDGLGTLGMSLASSTSLSVLHLTRESLKGDSARALLDYSLSDRGSSSSSSNDNDAQQHSLTKLVLNFCRFDDAGVDALADALAQNSHLQELDLGACYLTDRQVERVVLALKSHPTLRSLVLTLNGCHYRGAHAIGQLLMQQPKCPLEYLNLSHQKSGRDGEDSSSSSSSMNMNKVYVRPIAKALVTNTSLRWLRLSRNRLQCQDVESLFYALQTNRTLRVLDLNSNGIGDQGVPMLASSLSKAQGLRELHLLKNEIRSLQSSSAILQTLQESNRTLEVLELRPSLPQLSRIRYELALNAGGRRILSSGAYTNQVPLGLWPKILSGLAWLPWESI